MLRPHQCDSRHLVPDALGLHPAALASLGRPSPVKELLLPHQLHDIPALELALRAGRNGLGRGGRAGAGRRGGGPARPRSNDCLAACGKAAKLCNERPRQPPKSLMHAGMPFLANWLLLAPARPPSFLPQARQPPPQAAQSYVWHHALPCSNCQSWLCKGKSAGIASDDVTKRSLRVANLKSMALLLPLPVPSGVSSR